MMLIDVPTREPRIALPPRRAKPRLGHPAIKMKRFIDRVKDLPGVSPAMIGRVAGWPWADENLVLTAGAVLPGSVTLFCASVGEAALGVVGLAEVGLDPVLDGFHGGAVEGFGDAFGGPGADQGPQAEQQRAEAALLLVAF